MLSGGVWRWFSQSVLYPSSSSSSSFIRSRSCSVFVHRWSLVTLSGLSEFSEFFMGSCWWRFVLYWLRSLSFSRSRLQDWFYVRVEDSYFGQWLYSFEHQMFLSCRKAARALPALALILTQVCLYWGQVKLSVYCTDVKGFLCICIRRQQVWQSVSVWWPGNENGLFVQWMYLLNLELICKFQHQVSSPKYFQLTN